MLFHQATSVMAQNSIKFHAYLQQKIILSTSSMFRHMDATRSCGVQILHVPLPLFLWWPLHPAKKTMGEIPMDAYIQISLVEEIFPNEPWLLFSPLLKPSG